MRWVGEVGGRVENREERDREEGERGDGKLRYHALPLDTDL